MARLTTEQKRSLLASVPLFAGLDPRELEALVSVARIMALPPRKELFHKGDDGAQIYVVVRGKLKALTTSDTGSDVVFNILGTGEVLGEIALLGGFERTATVVAIDSCELLVVDQRDFMFFLKSHPGVAVKLLSVLADRLKRISEFVEDTLFLNLPLRLAKKLVTFAGSYGEEVEGGLRINLKLSQEEWGDLVGATRESINKQMRAWTEEGLVCVDGGRVVIRDMAQLQKLAGFVLL
jgi:CRP-like cAMP-binding protein